MHTTRRSNRARMLALVLVSMVSASSLAAHDRLLDEAERVRKAVEVLDSMMVAPDHEIPSDLLAKAHGVAVVPNVVKGAFIGGGRFGKGLVVARTEDGNWGTPSFVDLGGASVGFQIGLAATDLILVFMEPNGLLEMMKDNLKIGVEAAAVAGPVGRHVEAGRNITLDAPIYAYSRNKGVFAGVSLDGSVLAVDDSANQAVYGAGVTGTDLLVRRTIRAHPLTAPLVAALNRHAPAAR